MRLESDPEIVQGNHKRATFLLCIPTFGLVPIEFVVGFSRMQVPMNCRCESFIIKGMEVGVARNFAVEKLLKMNPMPEYLFFVGDDSLISWNSFLLLHEVMRKDEYDIMAGLYYMKADPFTPPVPVMNRKGVEGGMIPHVHFNPGEVVLVDLCGMDFTIMKSEVFRKMGDPPWFKTADSSDIYDPETGAIGIFTEDVYFCDKALEAGLKIAVHTGCRIGHIQIETGEIY